MLYSCSVAQPLLLFFKRLSKFSNEYCPKTNTNLSYYSSQSQQEQAVAWTNQNSKQSLVTLSIHSMGKIARARCNWFWFLLSLFEKLTWDFTPIAKSNTSCNLVIIITFDSSLKTALTVNAAYFFSFCLRKGTRHQFPLLLVPLQLCSNFMVLYQLFMGLGIVPRYCVCSKLCLCLIVTQWSIFVAWVSVTPLHTNKHLCLKLFWLMHAKLQSNPAISKSQGEWKKVRNSGVSK